VNNSHQHSLLVNASTEKIAEVRHFVGDLAGKYGFSQDDVHDIMLAVDEAFTNVVKHAYTFDENKKVTVTIETGPSEFVIRLADKGKPFDLSTYKEPNIEERIMLRKRGGVGVYLINKLMDRVEYRKKGGENEIMMSKKL
jgi:serine/threonine-protein kinase RsbW